MSPRQFLLAVQDPSARPWCMTLVHHGLLLWDVLAISAPAGGRYSY
jgi:hypothetical protein